MPWKPTWEPATATSRNSRPRPIPRGDCALATGASFSLALMSPEAGFQVPAGTLEDGEEPERGVLREAMEETGLTRLEVVAFLGE
jgi:8-oxo-dGTP pyrophosphatase MutT (NUDIX family)